MKVITLVSSFILLVSCATHRNDSKMVLIHTSMGDIKVKLYDDTPIHRDNFLKLTKTGFYDNQLFHRVINHFMIQAGDPNSKTALSGQLLGNGDPGYTLPAEFLPNHFHRRGALAAAREGDQINPEKKSSGSQFYLVVGKKFSLDELSSLENKMNERNYQAFLSKEFSTVRDSLLKAGSDAPYDSIIHLSVAFASRNFRPYHFSEEQKRVYTTEGGVPHLDGSYTVFGEVVDGMDVIDKIASVQTDSNDRPKEDIRLFIKLIK